MSDEKEITWNGVPVSELPREELVNLVHSLVATLALQNYLLERAEIQNVWPVAGSA